MEIYSKGGEPFIKFYNKKGLILDELVLSRYDKDEINKILIGFGKKYVPDLTWEDREMESKFFNVVGSGSSDDSDRKADL